jgi:hypothetical protein
LFFLTVCRATRPAQQGAAPLVKRVIDPPTIKSQTLKTTNQNFFPIKISQRRKTTKTSHSKTPKTQKLKTG